MTPFNLFGIGGDTNPLLASDSEDIDTRSIFGQMGANKRRAEYDNSLLGMVHNWATSEQRQPVQLPDDASWLDQAKEAGLRMLNLPNDMAAGGAKTMAHWLGAAGNPEMVEPLDMLAPLGIGAMAGMAGGLPSNSVGIFGGKLAKTADHAALARAEQMAAQGVDRDTIWKDTGWGRGVDGQWRFEIDDSAMPPMEFLPDKRLLAEKIYPQHEANKAYPGIEIASDPAVSINGGLASSSVGPTGRLLIGINSRLDPDTRRSAYLHEMQHSGPQATEGFARGGSMFDPEYSRLAGEVEARTVQKRANMTADERRARPMWYDYDVPENQQIVRLTADQSRSSLPGLLAGAVDEKPTGIRAFHGSPHDFDRFSLDKIGTGEGAQAYGHGLYFAENEGVAKSYRDKLAFKQHIDTKPDLTKSDDVLSLFVGTWGNDRETLSAALRSELGMQSHVGAKGHYTKWNDGLLPNFRIKSAVKDALRRVQSGEEIRSPMEYRNLGRMYEVRINANPDDFLDWDKPLSQQSEKVRGAVEKAGLSSERPDVYREPGEGWFIDGLKLPEDHPGSGRSFSSKAAAERYLDQTGYPSDAIGAGEAVRGYFRTLQSNIDDPGLSWGLREAGIPGIRYLDQGSRTAGEGSRNYVVFDDSLIDILRKYGLLGTLGGGSLLASSESEASPAGGLFGVP